MTEREVSRPEISIQHMMLDDAWTAYNHSPAPLVPGDTVVEKPTLGLTRAERRASTVFKIWRMLDPADPLDAMIVDDWIARYPTNKLDCIVGFISDDGANVIYEPHELAQLMLAPSR